MAAGQPQPSAVAAGGLGARIKGEFQLEEDDVIKIVVGQQGGLAGNNYTSSGGGGTYVIKSPYNSNASITGTSSFVFN